jgi:hypothetical protein
MRAYSLIVLCGAWIVVVPVSVRAGDLEPTGPPAPTMRTLDSLGFDCPDDPPGTTNLLFPFVTNQAGFDTGLTIANTGADPFGTVGQTGTCTLNFFGTNMGGPSNPVQTSAPVPPGSTLSMVLSSGGSFGTMAVPGFQGYMIAVCNFAYAHGFTFTTDGPIGQASVAASTQPTTICRNRKWNLGTGQ